MNKREFWQLLMASALAATASGSLRADELPSISPAPGVPSDRGGDLALINAQLWMMDAKRPRAEAALVRDGLITAVGSTREILRDGKWPSVSMRAGVGAAGIHRHSHSLPNGMLLLLRPAG